jgi:hypothetical protein
MLGNGHVQFGGGPMEQGIFCTSPAAYPTPFTVAFRTRLVAQTAEERFLEAVLDLGKERGWRHPRVDESLPIQRISWPRFEPSIEPNVW